MSKSIRVLIVDDNELTRSLLQFILRSDEYNVVGEATNAREGMEMARKFSPDVILLDHNMPNGYGLDIVAPLRQMLPESIILMVTTQSDQKVVNGAMERGANGFVVKPFNTTSVLATMREATKKFVLASPAKLQG